MAPMIRGSTRAVAGKQRQYAPASSTVALGVVGSIWVLTVFLVGREIDLEPHRPRTDLGSGSTAQLLDGPVVLGLARQQRQRQQGENLSRPPQQAPGSGRPADWYQQLHVRPVLATRNSSVTYPDVRWPQYDQTPYAAPEAEELLTQLLPNGTYANASNPHMVVAYNGSFFGTWWPTHALNCSVPCVLTSDTITYGHRADVMVFHAPTLSWDDFWAARKPDHQFWAMHSMESQDAFTVQQAASPVMFRMDMLATYKMSSLRPGMMHVPIPYINRGEYLGFTLKRPQMLNKTGLALWMHNNCEALSSRQVLVERLMQLMPVDAAGKCLHNKDTAGMNTSSPVELMAGYKFYLVFENVFGDSDWVSSTFFRALDAGAVPVVLGAPNVLKYAPGERSVIRACDFDSPEDLADYLLYLDRNDTAYSEYLSWKDEGPSATFQSLMATGDISPWCQMCVAAAQKNAAAYDARSQELLAWHWRMKLAFDVLNAHLDHESTVACRGKKPWWHVELSPEEEARLWAQVPVVTAPEDFGGDMLRHHHGGEGGEGGADPQPPAVASERR